MINSHVKSAFAAIFTVASIVLQADTLDLLLPKPVKGERLSGSAAAEVCANVKVVKGAVPGAPSAVAAEAYVLEVSKDGVTVTASDSRGERYARTTLEQLLKLGNGSVPCCRIIDWPAFRWRGFMNDCGRNYRCL